jgi:ATP phosphoribosyltransferase regulatory subunit
VENKFRESLRLWGYREVRTSTMDYFDIIRGGAGEGFADSLFKVQDSDGRLLSMRGEVTTQVARMLASKAKNEGRVYYIANCIKFQEARTLSKREFWQAGAELVGGGYGEAEADAEVMALTLTSLERMGLGNASIDAGNIELFRRVSQQQGIKDLDGLRLVLAAKSAGDLKKLTPDDSAREIFSFLMRRRGGPEVVRELAEMVDGVKGYAGYFDNLFQLLDTYGCADRVKVDLTTLREMRYKYYNGTVFEVFVRDLGVPIGGGGRYDAMMREFGLQTKATGFAVSVDLCVRALEPRSIDFGGADEVVNIFYREGYARDALALALKLRQEGINCTVDGFCGQGEGIAVGEETIDLKTGENFVMKVKDV